MNDSSKTLEQVICMLAEALSIDKELIDKNFSSTNHMNWDSLANMSLAAMMYDNYAINIVPDEVYELNSVKKLAQFIDKRKSTDHANIEIIGEEIKFKSDDKLLKNKVPNFDLLPLLPIESAFNILLSHTVKYNKQTQKKTIVIASTFTTQSLEYPLKQWCKMLPYSIDIIHGDFNQIESMLLLSDSHFYQNNVINIILLRPEDLISRIDPAGEKRANSILRAIEQYHKQTKNMLVVSNMPPVVSEFYSEANNAVKKLSMYWDLNLKKNSFIKILNLSQIIYEIGVVAARHTEMEVTSRSPYSQILFTRLGMNICRLLRMLSTPAKKVIALDADNTLWGGVIGEDGMNGIELGHDHPGRSFRLFQNQILFFKDRGILLVLVSKNQAVDVQEVLDDHPGMLLNNDDFASKRVNWLAKSENLRSVAKELNLGLDSFVFLDDSPLECHEVRENAPQVTVIQMPENKLEYGKILNDLWLFDNANVTSEDKLRNNFSIRNKQREQLKKSSSNFNDYLKSLNIKVKMSRADDNALPRVAQLSQKTNQFNLSLKRRTLQEFDALDESYSIWTVNVSDSFGDYGLVGACVLNKMDKHITMDSLYISCRALGRKIEHAFLYGICDVAKQQGVSCIVIPVVKGPRNQQVKLFLESSNCSKQGTDFILNVEDATPLPEFISWSLQG